MSKRRGFVDLSSVLVTVHREYSGSLAVHVHIHLHVAELDTYHSVIDGLDDIRAHFCHVVAAQEHFMQCPVFAVF